LSWLDRDRAIFEIHDTALLVCDWMAHRGSKTMAVANIERYLRYHAAKKRLIRVRPKKLIYRFV